MSEKTVVELLGELREMRDRLGSLRESEDGRRRAEEALRQSQIRFRDLVEQSLGLICTHDLDGVLLSINPAAAHASSCPMSSSRSARRVPARRERALDWAWGSLSSGI